MFHWPYTNYPRKPNTSTGYLAGQSDSYTLCWCTRQRLTQNCSHRVQFQLNRQTRETNHAHPAAMLSLTSRHVICFSVNRGQYLTRPVALTETEKQLVKCKMAQLTLMLHRIISTLISSLGFRQQASHHCVHSRVDCNSPSSHE